MTLETSDNNFYTLGNLEFEPGGLAEAFENYSGDEPAFSPDEAQAYLDNLQQLEEEKRDLERRERQDRLDQEEKDRLITLKGNDELRAKDLTDAHDLGIIMADNGQSNDNALAL